MDSIAQFDRKLKEVKDADLEQHIRNIDSLFSAINDVISIKCHASFTVWILFGLNNPNPDHLVDEKVYDVFALAASRGQLGLMREIYWHVSSNEERLKLLRGDVDENDYY